MYVTRVSESPITRTASLDACRIQLLSFSAIVSSSCPRVLDDLSVLYPVTIVGSSSDTAHSARFSVTWNRGLEMHCGESGHCELCDESTAYIPDTLGELEYLIDAAAVEDLAKYVFVHAGVIARGTDAILFPAMSGAGKSTLVAALCFEGFSYLSDEFAIVDRDSLALHPFQKGICLKSGGWHALSTRYELPSPPVVARRADGSLVRFLVPPCSRTHEDTRIRYIVVPQRQPGHAATLTELSTVQAFSELLRQSLNIPLHGPEGLEALARLAEGAQCYILTYDHLEDAVETLSRLVADPRRPSYAGVEPLDWVSRNP